LSLRFLKFGFVLLAGQGFGVEVGLQRLDFVGEGADARIRRGRRGRGVMVLGLGFSPGAHAQRQNDAERRTGQKR